MYILFTYFKLIVFENYIWHVSKLVTLNIYILILHEFANMMFPCDRMKKLHELAIDKQRSKKFLITKKKKIKNKRRRKKQKKNTNHAKC